MPGILVYALHYDGAFNKTPRAPWPRARARAAELGTEAHAVVVAARV